MAIGAFLACLLVGWCYVAKATSALFSCFLTYGRKAREEGKKKTSSLYTKGHMTLNVVRVN